VRKRTHREREETLEWGEGGKRSEREETGERLVEERTEMARGNMQKD